MHESSERDKYYLIVEKNGKKAMLLASSSPALLKDLAERVVKKRKAKGEVDLKWEVIPGVKYGMKE